MAGQPSFRELLQRVRRMLLDAYVHQDLPFEKIIEALQLEREVHQVPLVRALFVSQNVPPPSLSLNGLETNLIDIEGQTTKFDIAVFIIETAQGLVGTVNYRTDLFEQDTISKLCKHFEVLLQEVVTQPDALLDTLDMRTDMEKSQLLKEETKLHEKTRRKLISARRHVVEVEDNHTTN